jgi:hypothetical protein
MRWVWSKPGTWFPKELRNCSGVVDQKWRCLKDLAEQGLNKRALCDAEAPSRAGQPLLNDPHRLKCLQFFNIPDRSIGDFNDLELLRAIFDRSVSPDGNRAARLEFGKRWMMWLTILSPALTIAAVMGIYLALSAWIRVPLRNFVDAFAGFITPSVSLYEIVAFFSPMREALSMYAFGETTLYLFFLFFLVFFSVLLYRQRPWYFFSVGIGLTPLVLLAVFLSGIR